MTDVDFFVQMNSSEFDEYMCKKYPDIFRHRNAPMSETCMCWGFDIRKGWYRLLDKMCTCLKNIQDATGIEIIAVQVKEKWGGLRFYCDIAWHSEDMDWIDSWFNIIYSVINSAEKESFETCEDCGQRGLVRRKGWIVTLCDECNEARK